MAYVLALLISLLAGWSLAASELLFREEQRPGIFRGTAGILLLLALTAIGGLLAAAGILWSFRSIPSSAVMIVIAGGGWLGFAGSNRLHVNAAGAVNRLIVGVAGLLLLYGVTWSWLPPP
jgi:hypothetical protein